MVEGLRFVDKPNDPDDIFSGSRRILQYTDGYYWFDVPYEPDAMLTAREKERL